MDTFFLTLKTVALLIFYISLGFFAGKKKIVGENAGKTLAALLTFVIMPIYCFSNLSKSVTVEKISLYLEIFAAGAVVAAICVALCIPLSKLFAKNGYSRNIYKYLIFTPNLGYFGYPLVQAVFGEVYLAMYMVFTLPLQLTINTYGYMILTDKNAALIAATKSAEEIGEKKKARVKATLKRLLSAPLIGTFVGITVGLLPIELPNEVYEFTAPASECLRAIAMLLTGIVLSEMPFKTLFLSKKAYLIGLLRLIIYPIIFGGAAYLLYRLGLSAEILIFTVCLTALPAGMNVVVFPEAIGLSGKEGAQACFISYLMVIITLPLILLALTAIVA